MSSSGDAARAQVAVLAAVLAVMVAGATLVGACVLLLTASPQRALQLAMVDAPGADVEVGVALGFPEDPDDPDVDERVAATARDASGAVAEASALLTRPFGDLPTTETTWISTVMRYLPPDGGPLRLAYLAELDDPRGARDARLGALARRGGRGRAARRRRHERSASTSGALDLRSPGPRAATRRRELTVVGTFVPRPGAAWAGGPAARDRGGPELPRVHLRLRPVRRRARRARRERGPAAPGHPAGAARPDRRDAPPT